MTFLKGTTTWAQLVDKMTALACGEVADDYGVTASPAHKWRRQVAGQPVIMPPATEDTVVTQEHRSGYWMRLDDSGFMADRLSTARTFCRTTAITTGTWNTATVYPLLYIGIAVTAVNTVSGNYSNAVVQVKAQSINSTSQTAHSNGTNVTLSAAGTATFTFGGLTFSIQLGDPSGFLGLGAVFVRHFTPTYLGGIDSWRAFGKATGAPSYSVAPSGTAGTDWDAVSLLGYTSRFSTSNYYIQSPGPGGAYPGYGIQGMGIKTNAALTGNRYVVSFPKNEAVVSLCYLGGAAASTTSRIDFVWGGVGYDPSTGLPRYGASGQNQMWTTRPQGGPTFLQPFSTTPSNTAAKVEYWISVTDKHITVALNGESTYNGQTTQNYISKIVQNEVLVGRDPTWAAGVIIDANGGGNFNVERSYIRLGAHPLSGPISQAGVRDGGRDWQTGMGRWDFVHHFVASNTAPQLSALLGEVMYPASNTMYGYTSEAMASNQAAMSSTSPRATTPNYADPRWYLLALPLLDYSGAANSTSIEANYPGFTIAEGYVDHGFLLLGLGGFADGDELTDTATGKKYMLWLGTVRSGPAGQFWGLAQEEV